MHMKIWLMKVSDGDMIMLLLFKMHLYTPGMMLCALKVWKERKQA